MIRRTEYPPPEPPRAPLGWGGVLTWAVLLGSMAWLLYVAVRALWRIL